MDFTNKAVVVTGGTGALGTAVVEQLIGLGARCHVTSFSKTPEPWFALANHPQVVLHLDVNLGDEVTVERLYGGIPSLWASIHVAGGFDMGPFVDTSLQALDKMLSMNLRTAFLCSREAARNMGNSGGRIVNVAARPAIDPTAGAGMVAYTVSKAGVAALTQASARELAAKGIWVNAVAPSVMDTPQNRLGMPDADHSAWPKTHEVAEAIVWLASPTNKTTSGAIMPVYGRTWP